jgi:periplasmic divalent cation tolerance protein
VLLSLFAAAADPASTFCPRREEMKHVLMLSTAGSAEQAESIADHLVRNHLVACVNIVPSVKSIYRWKGAIETDMEVLMVIKTGNERIPEIEKVFREMHPYENPELIAIPIEYGKMEYLRWMTDSLEEPGDSE